MRLRSLSNGSSRTTVCDARASTRRATASLGGEREQRALGRIADDLPALRLPVDVERRVVAERGGREQVVERRRELRQVLAVVGLERCPRGS